MMAALPRRTCRGIIDSAATTPDWMHTARQAPSRDLMKVRVQAAAAARSGRHSETGALSA